MLTQKTTATMKEGNDITLRSLMFEKIHARELSQRINYLWNMGNMGNLVDFAVLNVCISIDI